MTITAMTNMTWELSHNAITFLAFNISFLALAFNNVCMYSIYQWVRQYGIDMEKWY